LVRRFLLIAFLEVLDIDDYPLVFAFEDQNALVPGKSMLTPSVLSLW